ncbi:amidase [Loktanella sp. SALINAS62]|uniref:amidase n=1 Tax=Loktanella sp. SALINAS62 TaxID=2706124 RepID=UPI001B8B7022|nr:amidase [Loktanella sp. SALINAS62]MBS1301398.1 amidase [Loktanella sp. SALINAS62]
MTDLTRLTAVDALAGMRRGAFSALDLTRACLARIAARDGELQAWLCLNPQAEAQAATIRADDPRPLAGLPVGIKDVFDTAGMPTTYNSPLFDGYQPARDAAAVALLRAAGAIVIGKTDTTEFAAAGRNAATGNPANLRHTPGGSSAGSAAAVADFHVPLALSTQTGGSTIRPASYCGVTAMKPSFGLISTEGMKRYAPSFDTVGFHARDVDDLALVSRVFDLPTAPASGHVRIGICRTPYADQLTTPMIALMDALSDRHPDWIVFDLPPAFQEIDDLHRAVMFAEGAAAFLPLLRTNGDDLHTDFQARIASRTPATMRDAFTARDRLARLAGELENLMKSAGIDALIAPAAPGTAPLGRTPGDPVFNSLWTALQVPCIALPAGHHDGLPIGLQVVGPRASDGLLLQVAGKIAPLLALKEMSLDTV